MTRSVVRSFGLRSFGRSVVRSSGRSLGRPDSRYSEDTVRGSRYGWRGALAALITAIAAAGACSDANPNSPGQRTIPRTQYPLACGARGRLAAAVRRPHDVGLARLQQSSMPGGWQAVDDALTRVTGGGDIITIDQFDELRAGAGVADCARRQQRHHVSRDRVGGRDLPDRTRDAGARQRAAIPTAASPLTSAGACYGLYPPSSNVARPGGSWNAVRLIVNGTHVEHWLNGVKIVEYELFSADWLARLRASPHRDAPPYGREPRGHIALQDHGDRVVVPQH